MTEWLNWAELNSKRSKREIQEGILFTIASKRIKYLGINLPMETKTYASKTIRWWWKKSKKTLTDGKIHQDRGLEESKYCQNNYTTQGNLQIQNNPYQITSGSFHRARTKKKVSKFIWKHVRPQITKAILKKEKWSYRNQAPWLQTILQSYSHQNSMVLVQK